MITIFHSWRLTEQRQRVGIDKMWQRHPFCEPMLSFTIVDLGVRYSTGAQRFNKLFERQKKNIRVQSARRWRSSSAAFAPTAAAMTVSTSSPVMVRRASSAAVAADHPRSPNRSFGGCSTLAKPPPSCW